MKDLEMGRGRIKKPDCVDHNKLENFKKWEYQTILPAS